MLGETGQTLLTIRSSRWSVTSGCFTTAFTACSDLFAHADIDLQKTTDGGLLRCRHKGAALVVLTDDGNPDFKDVDWLQQET